MRQLVDASRAEMWGLTYPRFREVLAHVADRLVDTAAQPVDIGAALAALHLEDLALATACVDGRDAAWTAFGERCVPEMRRAAMSIGGAQNADDLVQTVLGELYGLRTTTDERRPALSSFLGRSRLTTWLRAILVQRHVDAHRARRPTEPLDDEHDVASPVESSELAPDRRRLVARIREALEGELAALDRTDHLRLSLYYAQRLTLAEMGRIFGEHEATVSRKLARVRTSVRTAVDRRLALDGLGIEDIKLGYRYVTDGNVVDLSQWLAGDPE
ncbi:MAG: sigma-70 family RNA polymerase sigma factor [Vicinamibacterales bacterium]